MFSMHFIFSAHWGTFNLLSIFIPPNHKLSTNCIHGRQVNTDQKTSDTKGCAKDCTNLCPDYEYEERGFAAFEYIYIDICAL